MKCTRCNKTIRGWNNTLPIRWHIPICSECRLNLFEKEGKNFKLTDEERKIMKERIKEGAKYYLTK